MKNLTLRYTITQILYWAGSAGASSYATAYLLEKGFPAWSVGFMLAVGGLLSSVSQPLLASFADRSRKFILPEMLLFLSALSAACFGVQLLPDIPLYFLGSCYIIAIWCTNTMLPLINALNLAYTQVGYTINYGAARGIGAVATATSTLFFGFIIARWGTDSMFCCLMGFRILSIIVFCRFPKIGKASASAESVRSDCSIFTFFSRYKWYCVSLIGILFLGMYHAMTENYMIVIMERLGGNSSHVGIALFISAMVTFPVIFFFGKIQSRLRNTTLLKIAAVSFLTKAVLFCFANSIETIYVLQLLQITSYAFLEPTQVYYANAKVAPSDMVKGQAFITAAYALGCSAGNFAGGQLLSLGVDAILTAGVVMALAGTFVIFSTVAKSDIEKVR